MVVHCSLELKYIYIYIYIPCPIKIINIGSFFFILLFSYRASLSHSHLSNFSQAHSLKLSPLYFTFIVIGPTHPLRRRHRSSTSPTHQPSQAADQPQTHATIRLRLTSLPLPTHFRSVSVFFMWMLGIFDLGITSKNVVNDF